MNQAITVFQFDEKEITIVIDILKEYLSNRNVKN